MSRTAEDRNRRMLRARDTMDRAFARPLDVPALAAVAQVSPAHFARQFRATFGETPHRYLQRRRVERAMELLRETDRPVSEICLDVSVGPPEQPDLELVLMLPGPRAYDDATAGQVRELVADGAAGGGVIFGTDDCRATFEALTAAGVEFTQEPTERFHGTDCALRGPIGNPIRITQPAEQPVGDSGAAELGAGRQA